LYKEQRVAEVSWNEVKMFLEHTSGFSRDALHILLGVMVQLVAAAVLRRSVTSWLAWGAVLIPAVANELNDLWTEAWPDAAMQYGEGAKDLLLTMILPTLLLVLARRSPRLLVADSTAQDEDAS
jgi:hypothetical protein